MEAGASPSLPLTAPRPACWMRRQEPAHLQLKTGSELSFNCQPPGQAGSRDRFISA